MWHPFLRNETPSLQHFFGVQSTCSISQCCAGHREGISIQVHLLSIAGLLPTRVHAHTRLVNSHHFYQSLPLAMTTQRKLPWDFLWASIRDEVLASPKHSRARVVPSGTAENWRKCRIYQLPGPWSYLWGTKSSGLNPSFLLCAWHQLLQAHSSSARLDDIPNLNSNTQIFANFCKVLP